MVNKRKVNKYIKVKRILVIIIVGVSIVSCRENYDLVIKKESGIIDKYICESGKDTLNCLRFRFKESKLFSKTKYNNGNIDGSVIHYFPNGKIRNITNYSNGIVQGVNIVYNESGRLIRKSFYVKNKQVLFESIMINEEETIIRNRILNLSGNAERFAGELYTNINEFNELSKYNYRGVYVVIDINDTISINENQKVQLMIIDRIKTTAYSRLKPFCNSHQFYNIFAFTNKPPP